MTDHPAIAAYCARNCPAQKTILDLLDAVGDDLPTLGQSVALAALSALALHRNVLFDHVIGKAPAGAHRGQAIASALLFQPAKWMGPVEGWLPRMDHAFPGWIDDLLTPGEDGLCGWDVLLAKSLSCSMPVQGDPAMDDHALLARVAEMIERRHPEIFNLPHRLMPGISNAQAWAWFWVAITMRNSRLPHLGYLLGCGIDPDFTMPMEGGYMSMGSAALLAMSPQANLPLPAPFQPLDLYFSTHQVNNAPWRPRPAGAKDVFNSNPVWQALAMLSQSGMDPSRLVEPTPWTYTALGLLARLDSAPGQWTTEFLEESLPQLRGLGLEFGVVASNGCTLLDLVGSSRKPLPFTPASIGFNAWSAAATADALERFWCTPGHLDALTAEPRLVCALLDQVCARFDAWNAQPCSPDREVSQGDAAPDVPNKDILSLAAHLDSATVAHPISALGAILLAQITTQPTHEVIRVATHLALRALKPNDKGEYASVDAADRHARLTRLSGLLRASSSSPADRAHLAAELRLWAEKAVPGSARLSIQDIRQGIASLKKLKQQAASSAHEADLEYIPADVRAMLERLELSLENPVPDSPPPPANAIMIPAARIDPGHLSTRPALLAICLDRLAHRFAHWGHPGTHASLLLAIAARLLTANPPDPGNIEEKTLAEGLSTASIRQILDLVLCHAASLDPIKADDINATALRIRTRPPCEKLKTQAANTIMELACDLDPSPTDAGLGLDDRARLQSVRDANPADPRPVVMLYSEASLLDFDDWANTRKENEPVKSWRETLIGNDPDEPDRLRYRVRRLAQAHPALAALERLREAFPHFEDVISQVNDHLCLAIRGDGRFSLPPLLMAGPPGTGKTFFFQELAAQVDTTYRVMNMEGISGGFAIVGLDAGWSTAAPGIVFDTLMKQDATANPIILLDEVDKVGGSYSSPVSPVLLTLLEPHTARRFTDRCVALQMDISRINWVATANDLSRVDLPLKSRFNIVHVANPDYHARRAMARHIYTALKKTGSWGPSFSPILPEETLQELCRPAAAARDLRKNISAALAAAARANRSQLLPIDLPQNQPSPARFPWDGPLPEPSNSPVHIRPAMARSVPGAAP